MRAEKSGGLAWVGRDLSSCGVAMVGRNFSPRKGAGRIWRRLFCAGGLVGWWLGVCGAWLVIDLHFLSGVALERQCPLSLHCCTVTASGAAGATVDCGRGELRVSASQDRQSGIFWLRFQSIIVPVATPSVASGSPGGLLGSFLFLFIFLSKSQLRSPLPNPSLLLQHQHTSRG